MLLFSGRFLHFLLSLVGVISQPVHCYTCVAIGIFFCPSPFLFVLFVAVLPFFSRTTRAEILVAAKWVLSPPPAPIGLLFKTKRLRATKAGAAAFAFLLTHKVEGGGGMEPVHAVLL